MRSFRQVAIFVSLSLCRPRQLVYTRNVLGLYESLRLFSPERTNKTFPGSPLLLLLLLLFRFLFPPLFSSSSFSSRTKRGGGGGGVMPMPTESTRSHSPDARGRRFDNASIRRIIIIIIHTPGKKRLRARIFILFDDVDFFHIFAKSRSKKRYKKNSPLMLSNPKKKQ